MDVFMFILVLFLGALVGIASVLIFCAALAAFQEK
jgi:hypothetical protein